VRIGGNVHRKAIKRRQAPAESLAKKQGGHQPAGPGERPDPLTRRRGGEHGSEKEKTKLGVIKWGNTCPERINNDDPLVQGNQGGNGDEGSHYGAPAVFGKRRSKPGPR